MQSKGPGDKRICRSCGQHLTYCCFSAASRTDKEKMKMRKNLGTAVMNFIGIAGLVLLLDLLAARFSFDAFKQIIGKPGHIAFVGVLGLILAAGAFVLPHRKMHSA